MTGKVLVLVAVLVLAVGFGVWRKVRDGRMGGSGGPVLDAATLGAPLGARATLLQFSSSFCAPCRATRRILTEISESVDGVAHIELDVEGHLDLVQSLEITRTPTTFVLDADGAVVRRATGQPRKADVIAALGEAIPATA